MPEDFWETVRALARIAAGRAPPELG